MTTDTAAIRAQMEALTGFTPGPWSGHNLIHEEGRPMTPEELGEYVCNSVKMGDLSRFLFVSGKHDDGGDCDVCHTGNGPRGPANTALIAAAPDMRETILALCADVERLNAAIVRQAGAAKTLRECTLAEVQHLKDKDRREYHAAASLDSERLANEILTDESDKLRAENKMLRGLIADAVEIIYRADNTEGTCCCGENMLDHAEAMYCGHSPVDAGAYHAREWQKDARAALAQKGGE